MIKKIEMFTVICDNCQKSSDEDSEYYCWNDEDFAISVAKESDYIKEGEKHYCPDCYSYDDDDNIILKHKANPK